MVAACSAAASQRRFARERTEFARGVNFNDLPTWQRRGTGLYWEEFDKPGLNPMTGETVTARRRRIATDDELPMKDDYAAFIEKLLDRRTNLPTAPE